MSNKLWTILILVVVMAIAGVSVLYAAGNGVMDSPASAGQTQPLTVPDQAPQTAACTPGAAYNPACDVDHDGDVDIFDIQLAAGHWGQTGTYSAGAAPPCFDNANRYVDCGNGTVTDTVTGLVWLKDANCGYAAYANANAFAAALQNGSCGLTDNSSPGDWRLPTKEEWQATVARAVALGCTGANGPALTDTAGTGCFSAGSQPFINVASNPYYWTSSADEINPAQGFEMYLTLGVEGSFPKTYSASPWAVRGGK